MTEHGWQRLMRLSVIGIGYLASLTPSASQEHMGSDDWLDGRQPVRVAVHLCYSASSRLPQVL